MSLVQQYDFSSIITLNDTKETISIIDSIINSGNYFKNSPKYQTQENLFARPEAIWLKYRMTFLTSAFMYLGSEHKVGNMMAWCFKTNRSTEENRESYWHHHNKHSGKSLSGIMYLHIPNDVEDISTSGTEMAPQGPEHPNKFFIGPNDRTWNIYPSETWHRPGPAQSDQWRYVLAVDIDYIQ